MARSDGYNRAVGSVVSEERDQVLFGVFPGVRAIEPFLTDSGPALANVGVVGGIGSEQELADELPEDKVVRVENQEFRGMLRFLRDLSRLGAILQATRHRSQTEAQMPRPIRHPVDPPEIQTGSVEPEIEDKQIVVCQQIIVKRLASCHLCRADP